MFPLVIIGLIYVSIAGIIAFIGRRRKFGGWGYFFAGIVLTPIVGLLLVLASDPRPRPAIQ